MTATPTPTPRWLHRFAVAVLVMTGAGWLVELLRTWPGEWPGFAMLAVIAGLVLAGTLAWTLPAAALAAALGSAIAGRRDGDAPRAGWVVWIGPGALIYVSAGRAVLRWSTGAFVRQDLAAAVVPALLAGLALAIGFAAAGAHRLLCRRIERVSRRGTLSIAAIGIVAAAAVHVGRFPELLGDASLPALILLGIAVALGAVAAAAAGRRPLSRIGRVAGRAVAAAVAVAVALWVAAAFAGPGSARFAAVSALVEARGLVSARVARAVSRLGDRDGDHFGAYFAGMDCDDSNPAIHPLASDRPGNGIDEDCFEGDLDPRDVASARAARRASRPAPRQRVDNVVLITVDALRADALGFAAGARSPAPRTPALDALAARSTVFTRAYTQAPMTRRAFPALLAGRYPSSIHWLDLQTDYPYTVSHADNVYVAEAVRAGGIATGMVVAFVYPKKSRFDQGFDVTEIHPASRARAETNADVLVDRARGVLQKWGDKRFLLWLHFYEAHAPYELHGAGCDLGDSEWARYLSEICWIDSQVGRLIDTLRELGIADRTAIVFTGDHGEEFGEHGGSYHGDLYPEDLHVPLLVHVPGSKPRRRDEPVEIIDVAPTIAELLGVAIPPSFDGASLVPALDGAAPDPDRPVFAELIPDRKVPRRVVTLIAGGWQLIADFELGARELYDLRRDPFAHHNRLVDDPARASELERALRRYMALRLGPIRISRRD